MSNQQTTADDLLMGGGGAPGFKFQNIGDTVRGKVLAKEARQQRDPKDNKPKFWDDGNPMMQVELTLATDLRDPNNAEDDGTRRVFAKGAMLEAIRKAVRDAGAKTVDIGGTLAVRHTGLGEAKNAALNPPKLFVAQYQPPAPEPTAGAAAADDLFS